MTPTPSNTHEPVTAANLSLSNCDREQIQFAGAIQPHGVLLVLEEHHLRILQASANCGEFVQMAWDSLVGNTIDALLGDENGRRLRAQLAVKNIRDNMAHILTVEALPSCKQTFHVFANHINGVIVVELERGGTTLPATATDVLQDLCETLQALRSATSLQVFLDKAVEQIRLFSGFERVMAYRFAADGSGEVVAESKLAGLESYLSLHYPASDIPAPARRLFALSPLRHLPDADYVPVPIWPADAVNPLDLSYANLRGVSVMYTDYLRNMGVKATLVMPLFKAGQLWGLVSCMQHSGALYLPYERRIPLAFLSQMLPQLLASQEALDQMEYRNQLDKVLELLVLNMAKADSLHHALMQETPNLLSGIDASGVALLADAKLEVLGKTPSPKEIGKLVEWLAQQAGEVIATHTLGTDFPDALGFGDAVSGLLAVRLSRKATDWVIWFRPEILDIFPKYRHISS
jgi:chemotaxis family two-component system sensor kinase Cph1